MYVGILANPYESTSKETAELSEYLKRESEVRVLYPDDIDVLVGPSRPGIYHKNYPLDLPGIVLVRLGSNCIEHDFAVIRAFEQSGVYCANSSVAIATARNKLSTYQKLAQAGVPIPRTMLMHAPANFDLVDAHIGYPCVIKVNTGTFGNGVYLCQTRAELERIVELIGTLVPAQPFLVQEAMTAHLGHDVRVHVAGGKLIGAMRRISAPGDFRAAPVRLAWADRRKQIIVPNSATGENFPITDEVTHICQSAVSALGLDIAGVDLLFGTNGLCVGEVNANSGYVRFRGICGIDVSKGIADWVLYKMRSEP